MNHTISHSFKAMLLKAATAFLTLVVSITLSTTSYAQTEDELHPESCTSIVVGKNASSDGSVMTAHSCDSNYRTWLRMEKRKKYEAGAMEPIRWGLLHTEEPHDFRNVETKGEIPAPVAETYSFMNVAYPCMNEKQLAMGETTTEGKRELINRDGLFHIEELQRVALERCTTAREAIKLMGSLAEEYGYGDFGECLTVIDKNEAWLFEIYGSGKSGKKPGALWVAQRIPDDHVGISANIPRIGVVDFNAPDKFMYASDLKQRCKELGLWDGKAQFKFYPMVSHTKKNFSYREYYVLNKVAPSLGLKFEDDEMPFSVKPEKKVTTEEMFAFYRETYDDTEFDQVKNLKIGVRKRGKNEKGEDYTYTDSIAPVSTFMPNNMRTLLNKLKPGSAPRMRTIAVIQCSYSQVIKLRGWLPDEVGGVAYFSFDNPAQSPRIPIYAGMTELPAGFEVCGQKRYRKDAAIWNFREANRLATVAWDRAKKRIDAAVAEYEQMMMEQTPELEKKAAELIRQGKKEEAVKMLNDYAKRLSAAQQKTWEEMKAEFWSLLARSL